MIILEGDIEKCKICSDDLKLYDYIYCKHCNQNRWIVRVIIKLKLFFNFK